MKGSQLTTASRNVACTYTRLPVLLHVRFQPRGRKKRTAHRQRCDFLASLQLHISSMGSAGYVTVCVQLYCVSFHCLSLHVSAYMAIFLCVEYFHMSEKKTKKQRIRILQTYENNNILHTSIWPCRPKHVVKESEN
jgi:hypothetical protein